MRAGGLRFLRGVHGRRVVLLLGAFDPPTLAHLAVLEAGSQRTAAPGAFCVTTVLLDRGADVMLRWEDRLELLQDISDRRGWGLAVSEGGTYLETARAARGLGLEVTFVVGSDKLVQLEDPGFYPDGQKGVEATFDEVNFLVVPRAGYQAPAPGIRGVEVLDTKEVFSRPELAGIRATDVRNGVRRGVDVSALVPEEVGRRLRGYTSAR